MNGSTYLFVKVSGVNRDCVVCLTSSDQSYLVVQMLHDLNTYLHKAIPDTKLTIRKYLDVKFEYLVRQQHSVSFGFSGFICFYQHVFIVSFSRTAWRWRKWMMKNTAVLWVFYDIHKISMLLFRCLRGFLYSYHYLKQWWMCFLLQAMGEPLYRVSTGNYEYRLVLRCRQEARARFAKMRKDVLEKIELLDQKHGLLLLLLGFFQLCFPVTLHSSCHSSIWTVSVNPTKMSVTSNAWTYYITDLTGCPRGLKKVLKSVKLN